MTIEIGGMTFEVEIERKRIKNMYLRITDPTHLKITCNSRVTESDILRFLHEKENWILKQSEKVQVTQTIDRESLQGESIYWLGYEKKVRVIDGKRDICWIEGDTITFELKQRDDTHMQAAFKKATAACMTNMINEYRKEWDEKICRANGLPVPTIRLRYMTSRWGVCQVNRATITMSTRLIHYSKEALEYVLLHEYAHFLVPNHSARFYAVIARYMPEYQVYERLLK